MNYREGIAELAAQHDISVADAQRYVQRPTEAGGTSTILPSLDFETFSAAGLAWDADRQRWDSLPGTKQRGLPACGVRNYVLHPSFRILTLSYDLKDGKGIRRWQPQPDTRHLEACARSGDYDQGTHPWDLLAWVRSGGLIEGWNSGGFEWEVWNLYCVPTWGWPELRQEQLRDVMAKACHAGYPAALDNTATAMRSPQKKDPRGAALIRKLTVPRSPTIKNAALIWTPETAPEDFAALYEYCDQDIRAEDWVSERLPDLPERELAIWHVDQAINRRGLYVDREAVDNCISIVEQAFARYNGELRVLTGNRVQSASEVQELLAWMGAQGVHFYNLDDEVVQDALKRKDLPPAVHRALWIRSTLAFASVRKLFAIRNKTCADSRLRHQYQYAGALTHLWNGRDVQLSNLYSSEFKHPHEVEAALTVIASRNLELVERVYGDALGCVANCLRSVFTAAPGHMLYNADYTAIQAVVCAGLAGESRVLEVFHTHGKIYEDTASVITGKPLEFYLQYRKEHGSHHPDRQPYGKIASLSSQFGGWINAWKKFGADEFMTDEEIKQAILKWRAARPMTVELWGGQTRDRFTRGEREELYGLEGAAVKAIKNPGKCFAYRGIRYQMIGPDLLMQPPTDCTPIVYHNARLELSTKDWAREWERDIWFDGWDSTHHQWSAQPLYGGVCTQNVVAKVSREYHADALVRLEHSGTYLPVGHTHDEVLAEVAIGVPQSKEEFLGLINQPRVGCVDDQGRPWPVKAPDAEITRRMGKWG